MNIVIHYILKRSLLIHNVTGFVSLDLVLDIADIVRFIGILCQHALGSHSFGLFITMATSLPTLYIHGPAIDRQC